MEKSEIFFDYSEVDANKNIRSEFVKSLEAFVSVYHSEKKKGFFLTFKKHIALQGNVEKIKMAYVSPFEDDDGDPDNHQNLDKIKKSVLQNYVKTLTVDDKYWKFQLFEENDHLAVLHWSEYLSKNELIFREIFATNQKEGLIVNDHKVII